MDASSCEFLSKMKCGVMRSGDSPTRKRERTIIEGGRLTRALPRLRIRAMIAPTEQGIKLASPKRKRVTGYFFFSSAMYSTKSTSS
ncbi:MAG: hypothetical protein ACI87E_003600 [Mariniblastus sp.]